MQFKNGNLILSKQDKKHFKQALIVLKQDVNTYGEKKLDTQSKSTYEFMNSLANWLEVNKDE
jgi:hypothetical protein